MNSEELPHQWENYVILLIYMKSDKATHDLLRHITVINFELSLPTFFSQGKLCAQTKVKHITNCGTSQSHFLPLPHMRKSVESRCATTRRFRDFQNLIIWLGESKG
jgi:hypothetical protein